MDNYTQAKTRVLWEKMFSSLRGWRWFPYNADDDESERTGASRCASVFYRPSRRRRPTRTAAAVEHISYTCRRSLSETSFQGKWKIWALITIIKKSKFIRSSREWESPELMREFSIVFSLRFCFGILPFRERNINVPARRLGNLLKVAKRLRLFTELTITVFSTTIARI